MRPKTRTEKLDMETITSIKLLARDYGMRLSGYYDRSDLNAPGDGRLTYMAFLAAMGGGTVTPEQEARIARSLGVVRQSLRKDKEEPVLKRAARLFKQLAEHGDPDLLERGALAGALRAAGRAVKRLEKMR